MFLKSEISKRENDSVIFFKNARFTTSENKENPDLDPYVIWVICVNYLLNEQGIYGDEEIAKQLREQRNHELKYDIKVI